MADAPKVLAQVIPAAATLTTAYTVPGAASAIVNTLQVCNQATTPAKIRVSIAVAGAADTPKQYLYFDLAIRPLDVFALTAGLTLATTDLVRVYSDSGNVSFNLFGIEIT